MIQRPFVLIRKLANTCRQRRLFWGLLFFLFLCIAFWNCLPNPIFNSPTSTLIEDQKGDLISARIASDGQWRFPSPESIPQRFYQSILIFEDKNFEKHLGFDVISLASALYQNIKAGRIVRGASTISMQVIRLSRKNKRRTIGEKVIEIILAMRMEVSYSKSDILKLYMKEAPFGGNIIGLEAASWRYYGRSPDKLSWAETACLAVLPNSPALIYPGKNQVRLRRKRDRLLFKLFKNGALDNTSYKLALKERLPEKLLPIPNLVSHLLIRMESDGRKGLRNRTTVKTELQFAVNKILQSHGARLHANGIYNAATLILDVEKGYVLVYAANMPGEKDKSHENDVDLIQASRSTGSILKPLLFSMMLNDGKYLNTSLVADIPTIIDGYAPKNYFLTFDGAVPFKNAIARSLNVPSVRLLQEYGIEKFNSNLRKLGLSTLSKPANHYGLSIILGGAEGKLWDLGNIYMNMAYNLNYYNKNYSQFPDFPYRDATYILNSKEEIGETRKSAYLLSPGSIWLAFEAMNEVSRPEEEASWTDFVSGYKIAWKTGTSFGNRDGWAIGVTTKYVVAVWVGNADGEGRPELTGIGAASPIMFDVFKQLKPSQWFMQPYNDMVKVKVCKTSGFRVGEQCTDNVYQWIQKSGVKSSICPYTQKIYLDKSRTYWVNSHCSPVNEMVATPWFVLPPTMEYYYKGKNASYKTLPSYKPGCQSANRNLNSMDIIYPTSNSKIYVPVELDGQPGKAVFEVAHRQPHSTIFWYLDNQYLGSTKDFHELALHPEVGVHRLTVTDKNGERKQVTFEVVSDN